MILSDYFSVHDDLVRLFLMNLRSCQTVYQELMILSDCFSTLDDLVRLFPSLDAPMVMYTGAVRT